MSWSLTVAAVDVLLGMLWSNTRPGPRQYLYARIGRDLGIETHNDMRFWTHRHASLLILAWLVDQWPHHLRAAVAILKTPHLPTLVDQIIQADEQTRIKLKEIFREAAPRRVTIERGWWKAWLDTLPYTPRQLHERARQV
jgi:hypothetical protein